MIHSDNILVCDEQLYLIDLHKTRIKASFTLLDEASNLSRSCKYLQLFRF